jgi:Raf kinase inhibitor-like YbhB/YbcL family protein
MLRLVAYAACLSLTAFRPWADCPDASYCVPRFNIAVTSPDLPAHGPFADGQVLNGAGCQGGNISPAVSWTGAPKGTKSFALAMFDESFKTHWLVLNIPAGTTSLPRNAGNPLKKLLPEGAIQVRNDFGTPGYSGPCPPPGTKSRYSIMVFALDARKLPEGKDDKVPGALAGRLVMDETLDAGVLHGSCER